MHEDNVLVHMGDECEQGFKPSAEVVIANSVELKD